MERIYKFKGTEQQLNTLENLFRHIEYLGNIGASRNLLVRVDGDGNSRIKVFKEDGSKINEDKYSIEQNLLYNCSGVYDLND